MKKHLAVLCGVYYPDPSPTGICVSRFVELLSDEYDIDLICISTNGCEETIRRDDGVCICTLASQRMCLEYKSKGPIKRFFHFAGALQIKTHLLGNLTWFSHAAYRRLVLLHKKRAFDSVFSVCSPFAAHVAAQKFRMNHNTVHWCAYTVDPYSAANRIKPWGYTDSKLAAVERDVLAQSNTLLLSEELFLHRKDLYQNHSHTAALPYLLPKTDDNVKSEVDAGHLFDSHMINCVYAGRFYQDIRSPEGLLHVFSLLDDSKVRLHLFSVGCENIITPYIQRCKTIVQHDVVSRAEIEKIYRMADVLINVDNAIPDFFPSKVFEYIATGKKIVSFGSAETTRLLLEPYPSALCIDPDKGNDPCSALNEFLFSDSFERLDRSSIEQIYPRHTEQFIGKILANSLVEDSQL